VGNTAYIFTIHEPSILAAIVVALIMSLLAKWRRWSLAKTVLMFAVAFVVTVLVGGWLDPRHQVHVERVSA
jgi:uncharacterized paraquat-inducible protein A